MFASACGSGSETNETPPPSDSSASGETSDDAASETSSDDAATDGATDGATDTAEAGCGDATLCGASCVDLASDKNNCGTCGKDCTGLPGVDATKVTCVAGTCVPKDACTAGHAHCSSNPDDGCEVDTTTAANCGACGVACAEPTPLCSAGTDGVYKCSNDCGGTTPTRCAMACVDTTTNTANCGSCGTACTVPANATAKCTGGTCGFECLPNFADCDGVATNGCEVDLRTTPEHCGACTTACSVANGTAGCVASACTVASCNTGFADCDSVVSNGCEINTTNDPTHCGACTTTCSVANGTAGCASSACTVASCNTGFADCDGVATNGCEINTTSDVDHCGTCTNKCALANSTPTCSTSSCAIGTCNVGFADCNSTSSDGCEINTKTDASNCGACGNICSLPNASSSCSAGACAVAGCNIGFQDCNGTATDGCEVNLLADPTNCGACGNACSLPNASPACVAGGCAIGTCNTGFADCNGSATDGCEKNTVTDVNNCGTCGKVCSLPHATASCTSSTCAVATCDAGWADCNGNPADGCEVNIAADVNNCGSCAKTCMIANGTASCSAGTCGVASCNAGFGNCNGSPVDGCETNLTTDGTNCGTCGNNCTTACLGNVTATTCSAGSCSITVCNASFFNVDGTCSNGCECKSAGGNTCATSTSLGTVNVGQTITTPARNLIPSGTEVYYTVTFTGNGNASYHPRVRLSTNPGSRYRFDILTNCAGAAQSCGAEGGTSIGRTDWETFNGAGSPGYYTAIPPVGAAGTVIIHVYRAAGQPVICEDFVLTVSN